MEKARQLACDGSPDHGTSRLTGIKTSTLDQKFDLSRLGFFPTQTWF